MPANQPPTLDYASRSTDQQVVCSQTEEGATIVIRDSGRRGCVVSEAVALFIFLIGFTTCLGGCSLWGSVPGRLLSIVACVSMSISIIAREWWHARNLISAPAVIEVTPKEVKFLNFDSEPTQVLQRDLIYEVIAHDDSKMLAVRVRGLQTVGFVLSLPAAKIEEVAEMLRSVLGLKEERQAEG